MDSNGREALRQDEWERGDMLDGKTKPRFGSNLRLQGAKMTSKRERRSSDSDIALQACSSKYNSQACEQRLVLVAIERNGACEGRKRTESTSKSTKVSEYENSDER